MLITVEIPDELDAKMSSILQELKLNKCSFVRMAIEPLMKEHSVKDPHPYEKVKGLAA